MTTEDKLQEHRARVHWGRAVAGFVVLEIVMIAAAFGWVAIYSHLLRPGQSFESYQAYARVSSPIVSLVVGVPAFFAAGIWLRRRLGAAAFPTAAAMAALYLLLEAAVILAVAPEQRSSAWLFLANVPTKIGAILLGARSRRRSRVEGKTGLAA